MSKYVTSCGVYFDTSSKGRTDRRHHSYRAAVMCEGRRLRKRFTSYAAAKDWISRMQQIERNFWE